jgi:hypothetical protein
MLAKFIGCINSYFLSEGQIIPLFKGEQENIYHEALLLLEEKQRLGVSDKVYLYEEPLPKRFLLESRIVHCILLFYRAYCQYNVVTFPQLFSLLRLFIFKQFIFNNVPH